MLRYIAQALVEGKRKSDIVVRRGGEKFLILLPAAGVDVTLPAMRRLVRAGLPLRPDGLPTTASVGVAERMAD